MFYNAYLQKYFLCDMCVGPNLLSADEFLQFCGGEHHVEGTFCSHQGKTALKGKKLLLRNFVQHEVRVSEERVKV